MPTYTYRCKECEHEFDQRQSFSDDPLTQCPDCGTENGLRKVVNSVGIVFKGSGFYVTDNANGKGKVSLPTTNKEGGESSSASDSGSDDTKTTKSESESSSASASEKESSSKEKSSAKEKSATT